jgi:LuxR family maltose regulon positive regulatory protein
LLRTKLAPPRLPATLVPRPALLARLDAGLREGRKLTLIAAPPGFGKTTLVAAWVTGLGRPVSWVSLDAGDNDPIRFWRYLITACRSFDSALGKTALAALRAAPQRPIEAVLTPFLNELAQRPESACLVLEDYHVVTSAEVHAGFNFLLERLPHSLHLVLMSRSEPPLALARLRARNQLTELSAADLRFSRDETETFLGQVLPVALSPEAISRLDEKTEGWAAGLRLVALALDSKTSPREVEQFLADFSGGHWHVLVVCKLRFATN